MGDEEGERGNGGSVRGCGAETKTRYCQPLRHRNHHPPRETLNHFYCIELSLLPAERTSKRVLSVPFLLPSVFLPPFVQVIPSPWLVLAFLPTTSPPPPPPVPTHHLRTLFVLLARREIIRTRKRSHPFGCPNGISSLIREFTAPL